MHPLIALLHSAIADRLDAEGPQQVGLVVSGGLDSSTVACLAPAYLPTFTGYYEDPPGFDERHYAHMVCHRRHTSVKITPDDFVAYFEKMVAALKPPVMGMGTFGQFMLARAVSETGIKVVLSGEGSDELFGGYARQMIVAGMAPPQGYEHYQMPKDYPTNLVDALDYDLDRLPMLLAVDDQMTGAWGMEARAPFTDQRIVDYGLGLLASERVGKLHLREAVRGIVPTAIIDRTDKMGMPIPLVAWAQDEPVRTFVADRIGYVPDAAKPWSRSPWYELVAACGGPTEHL